MKKYTKYYEYVNNHPNTSPFILVQKKVYTDLEHVVNTHKYFDSDFFTTKDNRQHITDLVDAVYTDLVTIHKQTNVTDLLKWLIRSGHCNIFSTRVINTPIPVTKSEVGIGVALLEDGETTMYQGMYKSKSHVALYYTFLNTLFLDVFGTSHTFDVRGIIEIETFISSTFTDVSDELTGDLNMYYLPEILEKTGVDIGIVLGMNASQRNIPIIVDNLNGFTKIIKKLEKSIHIHNSSWDVYWIYTIIRTYIWSIPKLARMCIHFSNLITNTRIIPSIHVNYCINLVPSSLNLDYYHMYNISDNTTICSKLCNAYIKIFIHFVKSSEWLGMSSKNMLINKIKNIKIVIGKSVDTKKVDLDYKKLKDTNNWIDGLREYFSRRYKVFYAHIGKRIHGDIDTYTVNAFYATLSNTIYIPLGILNAPIIDESKGAIYNIAYIGTIIGHELSHCVDLSGMLYNDVGIYNVASWLTKSEKIQYTKLTNEATVYLTKLALTDGHRIDGKQYTRELVSDIIGFLLSEQLVVLFATYNKTIDITKGLTEFYTHYTKLWSTTAKFPRVDEQDVPDSHIHNKYRVNCVLVASDRFRKLHSIEKAYTPLFHSKYT